MILKLLTGTCAIATFSLACESESFKNDGNTYSIITVSIEKLVDRQLFFSTEEAVLRIRVREPGSGAFLTTRSGMGKNPEPG